MCVTVPCEVLRVGEGQAEVRYEGKPRWVQTPGFPDLAVGEYVTVYAGTVLNRMPAAEAEEVLRLFAELVALEDAANE
jgi:hydrogenase assembly chaperone HypC/HupF